MRPKYFCPKCGLALGRHSLYAYWDSHGLKELRCKECGKEVITFERAVEKLWDKMKEDE